MKDEKIQILDKTFKPYIRHERIMEAIDGVAERINADFRGCTDVPVILCVLNGSSPFTGELLQRIDFPCQLISIKLSSYQGTKSTGTVLNVMGLTSSVRGRRVIICEDIVDSGMTLSHLKVILEARKAKKVSIVTLLDKPERRRAPLTVDYSGFVIPDAFVVGYGLDYDERYRNLPDIGILSPRIYGDN